jgi:ABC-type nitrate/sulfonate/bicarbonate transport system permease component
MSNLGKFIFIASSTFNMPRMFAGIIFATACGAILLRLAEGLERRLVGWQNVA